MTCVVVAVTPDAAHVFADTAHVGPTGGLVRSERKVRTFPKARFALVTRGSMAHGVILARLVRSCQTFDEARERFSRLVCGPLGRLLCIAGHFEVYVAGIAASDDPAAFLAVSHRMHEGLEPWRVIDVWSVTTGPPVPSVDREPDSVAFGIQAAQLQRGVLQRLPFSRAPVSIVGGALTHTVISVGGVRTETLGGWSDRLGERLNPHAKFSRTGAAVRKARKPNVVAWLMPRTPWGMARNFLVFYVLYVVARIVAMAPSVFEVERLFHGAPQTTVETAAGSWDAWSRLDVGKLLTAPTAGREVVAATTGERSRAADHAEAARQALEAMASGCTVVSSREVLADEFEHELYCQR